MVAHTINLSTQETKAGLMVSPNYVLASWELIHSYTLSAKDLYLPS